MGEIKMTPEDITFLVMYYEKYGTTQNALESEEYKIYAKELKTNDERDKQLKYELLLALLNLERNAINLGATQVGMGRPGEFRSFLLRKIIMVSA